MNYCFCFSYICANFADAKLRKMAETILISVLIIAISVALLSVKLLLKKNGKFASQHVKDNPALRKKNIHCVIEQDREAREEKSAHRHYNK